MPKKDIDMIADELWWICKEYNGIPSQTVDKSAYAKALHYLKTYAETPQIKAIIREYNLSPPRTYSKDGPILPLGLEEIKKVLEERGRMPLCTEEKRLYHQVNYFLKKNSGDEEVSRLKMIYAASGCCPLYEKTVDSHLKRIQPYRRVVQSMEYVLATYHKYHELPARNTVPMKLVCHLLENPSQKLLVGKIACSIMSSKKIINFLTELKELGCDNELFINSLNGLVKQKKEADKQSGES